MSRISIEEIRTLFPELDLVSNKEWAEKVCLIWKQAFEDSKWDKIEDAQHNHTTPNVSLIDHSRSVTVSALAMIKSLYDTFGVEADKDVVIVSCLLHDVCKLVENEPNGKLGESKKGNIGQIYQHGFLSGYYAMKAGLPEKIVANMINHTPMSRVVPRTLEGLALYYADSAVADFQKLIANVPLLAEGHK